MSRHVGIMHGRPKKGHKIVGSTHHNHPGMHIRPHNTRLAMGAKTDPFKHHAQAKGQG